MFVIDNGYLVFSSKSNQCRLFHKLTSELTVPFYTTLGNHDIRGNGKEIYIMLYGPSYFSFDFLDSHFILLDSSPGWSQEKAISDEQYAWLEKDLMKAQGKRIFVTTHIPPRDPRSHIQKNEVPNYVDKAKNGENWVERFLDQYFKIKEMDHGFQDPTEAERFENLMSRYKVDTVYLSHIHSYFEYKKNGVNYLIAGGVGAELLTENSYYHFMVSNWLDPTSKTMVELPSPSNNYLPRYGATIQLFAMAFYDENPLSVVFMLLSLALFLTLLIIKIYLWKKESFQLIGKPLKIERIILGKIKRKFNKKLIDAIKKEWRRWD